MTPFQSEYQKLNAQQQKIVNWNQGLLRVNACPGSGKTQAIAFNIANLIINNIKNNQADLNQAILAITFTNKAAKELKERVTEIVALSLPNDAISIMENIKVQTIDRYCIDLLSDYDNKFSYFKIMSDAQWSIYMYSGKMQTYRQAWEKLYLKIIGQSTIGSVSFLMKFNNDILNQIAITGENYWIADSEYFKYKELIEAYLKVIIKNNKVYSYNDYKIIINKLLETNKIESNFKKIKYLFVDEVQDINQFQQKLITKVLTYVDYSVFVGDNNQSIYAFRGGSIECMNHIFDNYSADVKLNLLLNKNYRSSDNVIKHLNQHPFHKTNKIIKSNTDNTTHPIYHANFKDEAAFFDYCKSNILKMQATTELPIDDIAILVNSNAVAFRLVNFLQQNNIDAANQKIYLDNWLKYYSDKIVEEQGILFQYLKFMAQQSKDIYKDSYLINDFYKSFIKFLEVNKINITKHSAINVFDIVWLMNFVQDQQIFNRDTNLVTMAKSITDEKGNWKFFLLNNFVQNADKQKIQHLNKLNVVTHHSSKGKEWPVVINWNQMNNTRALEIDQTAEIQYVAMSRAKNILFNVECGDEAMANSCFDNKHTLAKLSKISAKMMTISFEAISNFYACINKYKVFNIYQWLKLDNDSKIEGSLIHQALELYNKELIRVNHDFNKISPTFIKKLQKNVYIRKLSTSTKRKNLKSKIQNRIANIISAYQIWLKQDNWKVINAEKSFDFVDKDLFPNKINFIGKIDLILQNDQGEFCVLDFKATTKFNKADLSTEKLSDLKYQVKFYSWILNKYYNYNVKNIKVIRVITDANELDEIFMPVIEETITQQSLIDFEKQLMIDLKNIISFNQQDLDKIRKIHCSLDDCKFHKEESLVNNLLMRFEKT